MGKGKTKPSAQHIRKAEKLLARMGITDVHGEAAVYRAVEEAKKLFDKLPDLRPDLFPSTKGNG